MESIRINTEVKNKYSISIGTPLAMDYCRLRVDAGLSAKSAHGAALGLPNTIYGVLVHHDDQLIGMGRLIGDGGLFFEVVDIAVHPAHQKRGLGKAIVSRLVEHVRSIAPPGALISLLADGDAKHLYAQYGFVPTAPASVGMSFMIDAGKVTQ